MFKKLDISLCNFDTERFTKHVTLNHPTFVEFAVDRKEILNTIGESVKFIIQPHVVNITEITYPGSGPHIDAWHTSINFYLEAGSDETIFWREKNPTLEKKNKLKFRGYDVNNLDRVGSFIAQKNDCYMLDVGSIHSVDVQTPNTARKILRLGWFVYSMNQILDSLILPP